MSRALSFAIVGLALVLLICLVQAGAFAPAPLYASLFLVTVLLLLTLPPAAKVLSGLLWERQALRECGGVTELVAAVQRLQGDFVPYVVEAARDLAETRHPAAAPVLLRTMEFRLSDRPAGWRQMVGAMAAALGKLGEGRALPLLRRARLLGGLEEIAGLDEVIASLEASQNLLRVPRESADTLLRPAESRGGDDPDRLLRPDL